MIKPILAATLACFIFVSPVHAEDLVIPPSNAQETAPVTTPAAPPAEAGKPDPSYCEAAEDCTIVYGRCGRKVARNHAGAKEEQKRQDALKKEDDINQTQCSFVDESIPGDIHCEKNKCKLDLMQPKFYGREE